MIPPPPRLSDLRAGHRLVAGMGISTILPDLDFETYSEAGYFFNPDRQRWEGPPHAPAGKKGLPVIGAPRYAEHPSTEVLSLAYDLKDGLGQRMWRRGALIDDLMPYDLFDYIAAGGLLEAWNVGFERLIWENVCVKKMGWPPVPRGQWRCAMAKARAHALPGSLDKAGNVLQAAAKKDPEGKRLLDKFSVPRNPTKADTRLRLHPHLEHGGEALYAYNRQDIAAEAEISSRVPDLDPDELAWWQLDQEINARGVRIDVDGVRSCIAIVEQALTRYNGELLQLTGGVVQAASEIQKLQGWLGAYGCHMTSLDEEHVEQALGRAELHPAARRALEIRGLVGSASVKKLFAMDNQVCADGRLRDLYSYHAARTGRTTGNGPQPTNLPNHGPSVLFCHECKHHHRAAGPYCPWCGADAMHSEGVEWGPKAVEDALLVAQSQLLDLFETYFGDALPVISGCLRGLFVSAPGYDLICSDYSAIEAVVLAELAGEKWRRDVFRTHGKIYEMSASKITGIPFEEFEKYRRETGRHHPMRKKVGKVAELACFSPDTQVLTQRGYVAVVDVQANDKLWDGVEWVSHQGVVAKGKRGVITLDGVRMTPTHPIFIDGSWKAASALASNENMLFRALENGSENLPSRELSKGFPAVCGEFGPLVLAGTAKRPFRSQTCGLESQLAATIAPRKNRAEPPTSNDTTNMPTFCRTLNIDADCSTGFLLPTIAAVARKTACFLATAVEASGFAKNGNGTRALSSCIASLCRDGMTRLSTWTGSMWTGITNPETFGLSRAASAHRIKGKSTTCKDGSMSWSDVYDIVNAGPRHRFTIKTSSGHLLVHNSGYQGWLGAWKAFGADEFFTDDEIKSAILAWRAASPAIVEFWGGQSRNWQPELYGIEGCAVAAISSPGQEFSYRGITFIMRGDALYCRLLSGRYLTYHAPRLTPSARRPREWTISYEGWNTNPKNGAVGWIRMETWGGRLTENIVQATARDIQVFGLRALERAGYHIVLHVYDEDVAEVPEGWGSVEEFERIMSTMPAWASDWPIRASGGWRGKRYRKD